MIGDLINEQSGDGELPPGLQYTPLGYVSQYVLDILPKRAHLVTGKPGVHQIHDFADEMASLVPSILKQNISDKIGLLDAKMIYTLVALVSHRWPGVKSLSDAREKLERKITETASVMDMSPIAALSYEDVVLNNPRTETRVFLSGEAGRSERAFYIAHQQIEELLGDAIQGLETIRKAEVLTDRHKEIFRYAHDDMKNVGWGMMSFVRELNRDHFNEFRQFFATNPFTHEKGPSGAFSAKIPYMDILLYGRELPAEVHDYLLANEAYFSPRDLAAAYNAMENPKSLIDVVVEKGDIEMKERCKSIAQQMLTFRNIHKGAVAKHIGSGVVGSAEGADAEAFLEGRRMQYQAAFDRASERLSAVAPHRPFVPPGDKSFHPPERPLL